MTGKFKTMLIVYAVIGSSFGLTVQAAPEAKDPTKYDCRVVVGYRVVNNGNKPPLKVPVYECPHKDKLAAGKCETSWFWGMRCKD